MSLHQVGDAPLIEYLLVDPTQVPPVPVDATVTATSTSPAGDVTTLTPTHPGIGRWMVVPPLPTTGEWLITWTAVGAGISDSETVRLYVLDATQDTVARPVWAPALADVAVHIPTRTREIGVDNDPCGTFTDDTTPTGAAVAVLIDHACAWVTGTVGIPVLPGAFQAAQVAAALWAAYWVELGYPERDADVAVYEKLRVDAAAAAKNAEALNLASGGASDLDPGTSHILATHSFPDPPTWADSTPGMYW